MVSLVQSDGFDALGSKVNAIPPANRGRLGGSSASICGGVPAVLKKNNVAYDEKYIWN
jgi:hypothetical protein